MKPLLYPSEPLGHGFRLFAKRNFDNLAGELQQPNMRKHALQHPAG